MARHASKQPTERELKLLQVLWDLGPSRLCEIAARVNEEETIALTTVATMLKLMEGKRLVKRGGTKGQVFWSAIVTHEETKSNFLKSLADTLFDGSSKLLVSHLLEQGKLSNEERDEIAALLKQPDKKKGKG